MKAYLSFVQLLLTFLLSFSIISVRAQYTQLHDFSGSPDGFYPQNTTPVSDGTFLYGMTSNGGVNGSGIIFKIRHDGTGYTKIFDFNNLVTGANPDGSLISDGTFLYGMTKSGGANNYGTIFKIRPDGTGFTVLLNFNGAGNGQQPYGDLIYDGTFLYGMTFVGGVNNSGVIFKIRTDGTGYMKLYDFATGANGRLPRGNLLHDGTFLYGMTSFGGANNLGVIFKIRPDGTSYTKLLDFDGPNGARGHGYLISDGTTLYGLTPYGGSSNRGNIFKINPDGTGYSNLHNFTSLSEYEPFGSPTLEEGFLYGMTNRGGTHGGGTIFKISIDGSAYSNVYEFGQSPTESMLPHNSLIIDDGYVYGFTRGGGVNGVGTIFKLALTPAGLTITSQPVNFPACPGDIATFSTTAAGTTNITYRWQIEDDGIFTDINNGNGYSGVTTSTFTINTAQNNGVGIFRCRINGDGAAQVLTNQVSITLNPNCGSNEPPVIESSVSAVIIGGIVTIDLVDLISDPDDNLDFITLYTGTSTDQGASATLDDLSFVLTLDYGTVQFIGTDYITVGICDEDGECVEKQLAIEVGSEIEVYNAISPNGDGKNEVLFIQSIDVLPDAANNHVMIFNRWGDLVFEVKNYNNNDRVFKGLNNDGKELSTGTYYYKIEFTGRRKSLTGYLSLKR
jgi:gliding motility-associated-like protein